MTPPVCLSAACLLREIFEHGRAGGLDAMAERVDCACFLRAIHREPPNVRAFAVPCFSSKPKFPGDLKRTDRIVAWESTVETNCSRSPLEAYVCTPRFTGRTIPAPAYGAAMW
eukprot:171006-Pleurochrysis_carterae.AAC.1